MHLHLVSDSLKANFPSNWSFNLRQNVKMIDNYPDWIPDCVFVQLGTPGPAPSPSKTQAHSSDISAPPGRNFGFCSALNRQVGKVTAFSGYLIGIFLGDFL